MKMCQVWLKVHFWTKPCYRIVLSGVEAKTGALLVCNELCNGTSSLVREQNKAVLVAKSEGTEVKSQETGSVQLSSAGQAKPCRFLSHFPLLYLTGFS